MKAATPSQNAEKQRNDNESWETSNAKETHSKFSMEQR